MTKTILTVFETRCICVTELPPSCSVSAGCFLTYRGHISLTSCRLYLRPTTYFRWWIWANSPWSRPIRRTQCPILRRLRQSAASTTSTGSSTWTTWRESRLRGLTTAPFYRRPPSTVWRSCSEYWGMDLSFWRCWAAGASDAPTKVSAVVSWHSVLHADHDNRLCVPAWRVGDRMGTTCQQNSLARTLWIVYCQSKETPVSLRGHQFHISLCHMLVFNAFLTVHTTFCFFYVHFFYVCVFVFLCVVCCVCQWSLVDWLSNKWNGMEKMDITCCRTLLRSFTSVCFYKYLLKIFYLIKCLHFYVMHLHLF